MFDDILFDQVYKSILDGLTQCVIMADDTQEIKYVNASFCTLVELPMEKVIGSKIVDYITPNKRRAHNVGYERAMENGLPGGVNATVNVLTDSSMTILCSMSITTVDMVSDLGITSVCGVAVLSKVREY